MVSHGLVDRGLPWAGPLITPQPPLTLLKAQNPSKGEEGELVFTFI